MNKAIFLIRKSKYGKLLLAFFLVMLLFTFLSRSLDSFLIPRIMVSAFDSGSLSYQAEGEGIIGMSDREYLFVPDGFKVEHALTAGKWVKKGDTLVTFQLEDLKQKREKLEREVKKQQLLLEKETLLNKKEKQISKWEQIAGDLALEEKKLYDAYVTMQQAEQAYEEGKSQLEQKRKKQMEYAKQQRDLTKEEIHRMNQGLSGDERQNDGQAELDYQKSLTDIDETYENELKQLEERKTEAVQSVNDMQDHYNQLLYNAGLSAKEDSYRLEKEEQENALSQNAKNMLQIDFLSYQEELRKLDRLILADGLVTSTTDGLLLKQNVLAGSVSNGNEAIEIGCGKQILTGTLDYREADLFSEGDSVTFHMKGDTKTCHAQLSEIQRQEDGKAEFTAVITEGNPPPGSFVDYSIQKSSRGSFDCLIPLSALRQDNLGMYCLIAEESDSILGETLKAVRVNVVVLERDETHAALNPVFTDEDLIITDCNKALEEGDRVRIAP